MKTIFFFICISLCTTYIYAQTNYYAVTKTFNENGYTYQCDVAASKTVTLYNKSTNYSLLLKVTKIQEKLSHKQMKVSFYSNMTHGHEQSAFPL